MAHNNCGEHAKALQVAINPKIIHAQVESSIAFGLTATGRPIRRLPIRLPT